jgi:hypothetical protein
MFGVRNSVTNNVLQKHFQHTTGFFVNQPRDSLHSATSCQTSNGGLRYSLDVVSQNLPVPLSTTFPQSFATFSSACHDDAAGFTSKRGMLQNFQSQLILFNIPKLTDQ